MADHGVQRGHAMDCAELPAVTQSQTPAQAPAAAASRRERTSLRRAGDPLHGGGVPRAHLIRLLQRCGRKRRCHVIGGGGLCVVGRGDSGCRRDADASGRAGRSRSRRPRAQSPWDWTDFVMFWPGWFSAFQLLGSVAVILTNLIAGSGDQAVRDAIESSVLAVCQYTACSSTSSCSPSCAAVARSATSGGAVSRGGGYQLRWSPPCRARRS